MRTMSNTTSLRPAAPPPLGETSDLLHPKDAGHTATLVVTAICAAVVNILFIIHAYVKLRLKQGKILAEDCKLLSRPQIERCSILILGRVLSSSLGMSTGWKSTSCQALTSLLKIFTNALIGCVFTCEPITQLLLDVCQVTNKIK